MEYSWYSHRLKPCSAWRDAPEEFRGDEDARHDRHGDRYGNLAPSGTPVTGVLKRGGPQENPLDMIHVGLWENQETKWGIFRKATFEYWMGC